MPIQNGQYVAPTWINNAPPAMDASEMQDICDSIANNQNKINNIVNYLGGGWKYTVYKTSQNVQIPSEAIGQVYIMLFGGGGGGSFGGGGGGGHMYEGFVDATPGESYPLVIGAGGVAQSSSTPGGTTTFLGHSAAGGDPGDGSRGGDGGTGGGAGSGQKGTDLSGGNGSYGGGGGGYATDSKAGGGGNGGTYGGGGGGTKTYNGGNGGEYGGNGGSSSSNATNGTTVDSSSHSFSQFFVAISGKTLGSANPGTNSSQGYAGGGGYGGNGGNGDSYSTTKFAGGGGGGYGAAGGNGAFSSTNGGGGGGGGFGCNGKNGNANSGGGGGGFFNYGASGGSGNYFNGGENGDSGVAVLFWRVI